MTQTPKTHVLFLAQSAATSTAGIAVWERHWLLFLVLAVAAAVASLAYDRSLVEANK